LLPAGAKANGQRVDTDPSRRKRRAHLQQDAVLPDFVKLEFLASLFFNALRFLVTVSSALSGCNSVLKASFSKLLSRP
jgi:hypothetical protein